MGRFEGSERSVKGHPMYFRNLPEISRMGEMLFDVHWARTPHASGEHELLHVIKGSVELDCGPSARYPAREGDTLINPAGTMHLDIFDPEKELEIFFIQFSWADGADFFSKVNNAAISLTPPDVGAEIKTIFDAMRVDFGAAELDRNIANARLMNILLLLLRAALEPGAECRDADDTGATARIKRKKLVLRAKKYIDRFFRQPIHLDDVANHLGVSTFHISRVFGSESDFSVVEYITEKRVGEAKKLLADGRYVVADVARMVGYEDPNYFSKVFKRRTGCTPGKFHA